MYLIMIFYINKKTLRIKMIIKKRLRKKTNF